MDPDEVQARVRLTSHLFKQSMRGISEALAMLRAPPIAPAEKEQLFASLERGVWELPALILEAAPLDSEDWEERVDSDPRVRDLLERVVDPILQARRPK